MTPRPRSPAASIRLFLALWPAPRQRAALAHHGREWGWNPGPRLVAPDNLHLTLHFIGNVPRERLPQLRQALGVPCRAFELRLDQPQLWPHGIAVLTPQVIPDALLQLHAALGAVLRRLDLPTEARDFRPHVTFARHAQGATPPPAMPAIDWPVRGYALVEARPGGAIDYRVLETYPCCPDAGDEPSELAGQEQP